MTKKLSVILSLLFTLLHVNASNMLFHNDVNINCNNFYNIKLPFDDNVVNTIFQDSNKLFWICTKRGIVNYNGYNYHLCYYGKNMPDHNLT